MIPNQILNQYIFEKIGFYIKQEFEGSLRELSGQMDEIKEKKNWVIKNTLIIHEQQTILKNNSSYNLKLHNESFIIFSKVMRDYYRLPLQAAAQN